MQHHTRECITCKVLSFLSTTIMHEFHKHNQMVEQNCDYPMTESNLEKVMLEPFLTFTKLSKPSGAKLHILRWSQYYTKTYIYMTR